MKRLMIAFYAGLAITVWLVFLPPAEDVPETSASIASRAAVRALPTSPTDGSNTTAGQRETRPVANPVETPRGHERYTVRPERLARTSGLPTVRSAMVRSGRVTSTADEDRETGVAGFTDQAQIPPFPSQTGGKDKAFRTRQPSASAEQDAQAGVVGFAYLPAATPSSTGTAPEASPAASTAVTETVSTTGAQSLDNTQDTAGTGATGTTATTDAGVANDTGATPVTDNTTATGNGDTFLPKADSRTDRPGNHTPTFQCPTSCYIECTPYEINMLITQGCPVPQQ